MAIAIKPDERNKVILLLSLTGIVLIYGVGSTMSAMRNNNASSNSGTSAASDNGNNDISQTLSTSGKPLLNNGMPTAGTPSDPNGMSNASRLDDLYGSATPGASVIRDPFVPVAPSNTPQQTPTQVRRTALSRPVDRTTIEPGFPGIDNRNLAGTQSHPILPGMNANNHGGPINIQPVAPQISLSGVILGQPSLAVLMVNARPYELTVGQKLPQGYIVTGISDNAVALKKGNRTYRLEVGHALNGSVPGALPMAPSIAAPTAIATLPSGAGPTTQREAQPEPLMPQTPSDQQAQQNADVPTQTVRPVQNEEQTPDAKPRPNAEPPQ